jgi:hypothetical protein
MSFALASRSGRVRDGVFLGVRDLHAFGFGGENFFWRWGDETVDPRHYIGVEALRDGLISPEESGSRDQCQKCLSYERHGHAMMVSTWRLKAIGE